MNLAKKNFDFGIALAHLRRGTRVCRVGWNGKGMYLFYQKSQAPWLDFIAMKTVQDTLVPWLASQTDVLASDWMVVE